MLNKVYGVQNEKYSNVCYEYDSLVCWYFGCNRSNEMSVPEGKGKIAFISYSDDNSDIYIINEDGSGLKKLTNSPLYEGLPYWSPDGSQIVYQASMGEDEPSQLYIMNADGSNNKPITNDNYNHSSPSWSPDGTKIAYSGKNGNVHVINVDGSGETQVTDLPGHVFLSPTWSPDSKKMLQKVVKKVKQFKQNGGSWFFTNMGIHG